MEKIFFKDIDRTFISHFKTEINNHQRIIITTHQEPDDDAISSTLATKYFIENNLQEKKDVRIVITGKRKKRWENFSGYDEIIFASDMLESLTNKDLLICLDASEWHRFTKQEPFKGKSICIDHHPNKGNSFNIALIAPQYTSTAEIIYRLFFEKDNLNEEIASTLLLGILGDTGSFTFIDQNSSGALTVAERLVREGKINIQTFKSSYNKNSPGSYRALQIFIQNSEIISTKWPKFLCTHITQEQANKFKDEDVSSGKELFMHHIRSIEDITWGFTLRPKGSITTTSMRSEPCSINVRKLCEALNIGSGHDRASGGKFETTPLNAKNQILEYINSHEAPYDDK